MRTRFYPIVLGVPHIADAIIPPHGRDGIFSLLRSLQGIFSDNSHRDLILDLIEAKFKQSKNIDRPGRPGMPYWTIFVFSQLRLALNCSYDRLEMEAHNHLFRNIMGLPPNSVETFSAQRIADNINHLDEEVIRKINDVIVAYGHSIIQKSKKKKEKVELKADSFVILSNVHFPTDSNLAWDALRKALAIIDKLKGRESSKNIIEAWRKREFWRKRIKGEVLALSRCSRLGGANKEERQKELATKLLDSLTTLVDKFHTTITKLQCDGRLYMHLELVESLIKYIQYLEYQMILIQTRIIDGETIIHRDKVFSLFEDYTEWITKGKRNPELGKNATIITDQNQLIIDWDVMDHKTDSQIIIPLMDKVLLNYNKVSISSISLDRGYWHSDTKQLLGFYIQKVVMPKKGKCNQAEKEEEAGADFKKLKNKHSAVESNIHATETRGLDRCPDRGFGHFKRYIGLGICATNLCTIGRLLKNNCKKNI